MSIKNVDHAKYFSDSHPHFTPEWLSHRIARHLASRFSGSIVDPACGAGNLLAAAAIRTRAYARAGHQLQFVGIDTSKKAVSACRNALAALLPQGNTRVDQADFLGSLKKRKLLKRVAVLMNPPFGGYGTISKTRREKILRLLELEGRFNLSHAFVYRAIEIYRPEILVSLLPSNWIHARKSSFRTALDSLEGKWEWDDVGDWPNEGINAHVGILVWRPGRSRRGSTTIQASPKVKLEDLIVRQGVATGRDDIFCELGDTPIPFGTYSNAVRGRDIERMRSQKIWMPPRRFKKGNVALFERYVSKGNIVELKSRSCVVEKRKKVFEYHESIPSWFYRGPKVLIPEILSGNTVRVELDESGKKLPLHSAIAIKVPDISAGRKIRAFLKRKAQSGRLRTTGPRLAGGAVRLQVGVLRDLLARWVRTSFRKHSKTRRS